MIKLSRIFSHVDHLHVRVDGELVGRVVRSPERDPYTDPKLPWQFDTFAAGRSRARFASAVEAATALASSL